MPEGLAGSKNTTEKEICGQQFGISPGEAWREKTHGSTTHFYQDYTHSPRVLQHIYCAFTIIFRYLFHIYFYK